MKLFSLFSFTTIVLLTQIHADEVKQIQNISKVEDRKSVIVNKTDFKKYFTGGEVRIDPLYPKS